MKYIGLGGDKKQKKRQFFPKKKICAGRDYKLGHAGIKSVVGLV
jgi:hypothetical protein